MAYRSGRLLALTRWVAVLAVLVTAAPARCAQTAQPLPSPSGPVLLTVSGAIANTNAPGEARFDRAMLETLGLTTLQTHTSWHNGRVTFEGVPFQAVLKAVGAGGTAIEAVALNDYRATIPASDLTSHTVFLALKENGVILTPRDRGPLWIVYALNESEVGKSAQIRERMVWQLTRLIVQ